MSLIGDKDRRHLWQHKMTLAEETQSKELTLKESKEGKHHRALSDIGERYLARQISRAYEDFLSLNLRLLGIEGASLRGKERVRPAKLILDGLRKQIKEYASIRAECTGAGLSPARYDAAVAPVIKNLYTRLLGFVPKKELIG